ncbi:MAG: hypothetical protein OEU94_10900 [Aquincola sp.]|nr:hypothetical protein [Aquincola sp.]MDH4289282.1 hypothetical protein [Aquincola sp.]MDH5330158.1 hypothetical protein [Aquincola sp.]
MSLRWSEHVCAALMPGAVAAAVWPRGWARDPIERAALACAAAGPGPRWSAAANGLRDWISGRGTQRTGVRIVLSNQFVRYVVVPWRDSLCRLAEREALAVHLLRETYGELVERWQVKVAPGAWGAPALACAVDREFLGALQALCPGTPRSLDATEPLLMVAFNQFRREIARDACLMVLEPECLCCAVFRGGQWSAVNTMRIGPQGWSQVLVDRQIALHGLSLDFPVYLYDASGRADVDGDDLAYRLLTPSDRRRADPALALFSQAA